MSVHPIDSSKPSEIWFTRCPVPTATGLAYKLGWLSEEFAASGIKISTIQDGPEEVRRHHYDHGIPTLIREGGNTLAIAARAQNEPTRLIGLTWIDEGQSILVRPDSAIREPRDLKGARLAVPGYSDNPIAAHVRGTSIGRSMSLAGYKGALAFAGLTFDDVTLVEVPSGSRYRGRAADAVNAERRTSWALHELLAGEVDAVYVKGAASADAAKAIGAVVGIDLDRLPERRFRVNNGTPRPITVHQRLLDEHFDLVVRFLYQTLRAADWAADNLDGVRKILEGETRGSSDGVIATYRDGFHRSLHPDLSKERLDLFSQQQKFLWLYGFLERDFSVYDWADARPLQEAQRLLAQEQSRPVLKDVA